MYKYRYVYKQLFCIKVSESLHAMYVELEQVIKIIEDNIIYRDVIYLGDGEYDGLYCCNDLYDDVISKLQLLPSISEVQEVIKHDA